MSRVLKKIWDGWKRFARGFARVQTVIILTIFYFLVYAPFGAILRLFGWDPLKVGRRHARRDSNWKKTRDGKPDPGSMYRMS